MNDLHLLLAHADDHEPVVDGLDDDACHGEGRGFQAEQPEHLWNEGGEGNDLHAQRWGVIAPEGARGDRLLGLIEPLIQARREQQGAEPIIYRVPAEMSAREAAAWRKTVFDDATELRDDLPRYQLILGDLHEVPLSLQLFQQSDGYVGRLAFDADAHYAAYVDKLLRWERAPAAIPEARSIFATVHDRTAATTVGFKSLVGPSLDSARRWQQAGKYAAADVVEVGDRDLPDPDELLNAVNGADPAVLFSLSHGEGAPRGGWDSTEEMLRRQGAMSFGRQGKITGDDIANQPFLPGGFWFMLACFGAGTPSASKYAHWLKALRDQRQFRGRPGAVLKSLPSADQRPFIAALPKAALANPNGPLTFMGHIDLAWTYSFRPLDAQVVKGRPALFTRILKSALAGDRAGVAFREIPLAVGQAETELSDATDGDQRAQYMQQVRRPDPKRGHLWMLRQDLLGYVTLGDPAARLPIRRPAKMARRSATPAYAVQAAPTPAAPAAQIDGLPADFDLDELEEAVGRLWAGEGLKSIAADVGLDRAVLRKVAKAYRGAGRRAIGRDDDD